MNIKEQLLAEMSRRNIDYIAHYIENDQARFDELIEIVLTEKKPLPLRAAWAISVITDKYPHLLFPHIDTILKNIESFEHTGLHRLFMRYFTTIEIEEQYQGILYDICYRWLLSENEPIAVKANCMQLLYNIAKTEPDLKNELRLICEELVIDKAVGIRNKSQKMLKLL